VVYIYRNPKDSRILNFHELWAFGPIAFAPSFEEWVPQYIAGRTPFGSWLEKVLEWTAGKHDMLHFTYDEVKADPAACLRRVSEFIGRPVPDERIAQVVSDTHFDTMKDSAIKKQLNIGVHDETVSPFMRLGKTGGWRTVLTEEQSRLFDDA
jgi:hypothetical protein